MPVWTPDFLSSPAVTVMNRAEVGSYALLLMYQWESGGCGLPKEGAELRTLARARRGDDLSRVLANFEERDGRLYNLKLHDQWADSQDFYSERSETGKKGAEARWLSHASVDSSAMQESMASLESEREDSSLLFEVEHWKEPEEESQANQALPSSGSDSSPDPRSVLRAELEWRAAETWAAHVRAWSEHLTRRDGAPPGKRLLDGLEAHWITTKPHIVDALRRFDRERLKPEDRERWAEESPVRAAGIGMFYESFLTGEDTRRNESGTRYLEHWRPWRPQRGKPDPVPRFAELYFAKREWWERHKGPEA